MSEYHLVGNLTAEPELRFSASGLPVATLRVAENHSRVVDGEKVEETIFWNVSAWKSLAENACESLHKGDRVLVSGWLKEHAWTTESDERRSRLEITARQIGADLSFASATIVRNERRSGAGVASGPAPVSDEVPF